MNRCSRRHWLLGLGVAIPTGACAQSSSIHLEDLLRAGEAWLKGTLDEALVQSLGEVDYEKVRLVMAELQRRMDGAYVIDLAQLRTAARVALPLLQRNPQTRPYAEWLEPRMDYLEVADVLRLSFPPPTPARPAPSVPPSRTETQAPPVRPPPPPPPPIPTAEQERQAWREHLQKRPIPARADPYVKNLKPVFLARGVPAELVWLAEVESSFNPTARSPVGAVGLYQLMPATAEWLGLKLKPKDQRLDPGINADAAARYLRYLWGKFQNWELVLAAYNAGEGRVRRLMDTHKTRNFDRLSPHLPAETQMYVPRFEATLLKREGIPLARLGTPA